MLNNIYRESSDIARIAKFRVNECKIWKGRGRGEVKSRKWGREMGK